MPLAETWINYATVDTPGVQPLQLWDYDGYLWSLSDDGAVRRYDPGGTPHWDTYADALPDPSYTGIDTALMGTELYVLSALGVDVAGSPDLSATTFVLRKTANGGVSWSTLQTVTLGEAGPDSRQVSGGLCVHDNELWIVVEHSAQYGTVCSYRRLYRYDGFTVSDLSTAQPDAFQYPYSQTHGLAFGFSIGGVMYWMAPTSTNAEVWQWTGTVMSQIAAGASMGSICTPSLRNPTPLRHCMTEFDGKVYYIGQAGELREITPATGAVASKAAGAGSYYLGASSAYVYIGGSTIYRWSPVSGLQAAWQDAGYAYYGMGFNVTDGKMYAADSQRVYRQQAGANNPPPAPTWISPANGSNDDLQPTLTFACPQDPDGDSMHFEMNAATNAEFTANLHTWSTLTDGYPGWEVSTNGGSTWVAMSAPVAYTASTQLRFTPTAALTVGTWYFRVRGIG